MWNLGIILNAVFLLNLFFVNSTSTFAFNTLHFKSLFIRFCPCKTLPIEYLIHCTLSNVFFMLSQIFILVY